MARLGLTAAVKELEGGPGLDYYCDPKLRGTTINYLTSAPAGDLDVYTLATRLFEKETGIRVNVRSERTYNKTITRAESVFKARSPLFDVIQAGKMGAIAYDYWSRGYITPIQGFLDKTPDGWLKDDILPIVRHACSTYRDDGGELLSLPEALGNIGLAYRYDLLESLGVPVPLPETCGAPRRGAASIGLEELIAELGRLHDPPTRYGFSLWSLPFTLNTNIWQHFVWSHNVNYLSPDFEPNFLAPDVLAGSGLYVDLCKKFNPRHETFEIIEQNALFHSGRMAAGMSSNNCYSSYFSPGSKVKNGEIRYSQVPPVEVSATSVAGGGPVISSFSKKQDAAWSFISWITSPRMQQVFFRFGYGPFRRSVLENPANIDAQDPAMQVNRLSMGWYDGAKPVGGRGTKLVYGPYLPKIPGVVEFARHIGTQLGMAVDGKQTTAQAMKSCQAFSESFFKRSSFRGRKFEFGT